MPRCPFAPHGMGSDLLAACPGFTAVEVRFDEGPGTGLQGITCAHIGHGQTRKGYTAICVHPDAERIVAVARRLSAAVPTRAAARDASRPALIDP